MMLFRQQMDESNHEMVNLFTQQIGTMFNPLIQSKNQSYQALATQMGRISDFFIPLQPVYQRIPPYPKYLTNLKYSTCESYQTGVQRQQLVPQPQPVEPMI